MTSTDEMTAAVVLTETTTSEPLLVIHGELDGDPDDIIGSAITNAAKDASTVHLDLSGVDFMGSAGLAVFLRAARALDAEDKRLVIDAASYSVRRVLEVTATEAHFSLPARDDQA
jgi:anti-sigma B factor antagonist